MAMDVELYTPKPHQVEDEEFICVIANGRGIIGDEMGLGKTGAAYGIIKRVWGKFSIEARILVVSGKNAQYVWQQQAPHWGCVPPYIIEGPAWKREQAWNMVRQGLLSWVACTREVLKRDFKSGWVPKEWTLILVDEAHKDTNRKTQNFKTLKALSWTTQFIVFITGSPMRRGPQNLWALLNILYPKRFASYWRFVETFCIVIRNEFNGWEILGPRNLPQLSKLLSTIMIRHEYKDVAAYVPAKNRILDHKLDLTPQQQEIYDDLVADSIAELGEEDERSFLVVPTVLAKIVRLRQLLCCPRILDPNLDDGAGLDHLVELLEDSDPHMVVFTPFTDAIPFIHDRLVKEGFSTEAICRLKGGFKTDIMHSEITRWQQTRGIMICSVQFAESFDLVPATWAYFLGYEWDPNINLQAEDRLRRIITTYPTSYIYPTHRGCIDEELLMPALDVKSNAIRRVLQSASELRAVFTKQHNTEDDEE